MTRLQRDGGGAGIPDAQIEVVLRMLQEELKLGARDATEDDEMEGGSGGEKSSQSDGICDDEGFATSSEEDEEEGEEEEDEGEEEEEEQEDCRVRTGNVSPRPNSSQKGTKRAKEDCEIEWRAGMG